MPSPLIRRGHTREGERSAVEGEKVPLGWTLESQLEMRGDERSMLSSISCIGFVPDGAGCALRAAATCCRSRFSILSATSEGVLSRMPVAAIANQSTRFP